MEFSKIGFGTPVEERLILYWEKTGHIEDGILYFDDDHKLSHYLFDGECLNDEPTHYALYPEKSEISQ